MYIYISMNLYIIIAVLFLIVSIVYFLYTKTHKKHCNILKNIRHIKNERINKPNSITHMKSLKNKSLDTHNTFSTVGNTYSNIKKRHR